MELEISRGEHELGPLLEEGVVSTSKRFCGKGCKIFFEGLVVIHALIYLLYFILDVITLYDQTPKTTFDATMNILWTPINLLNFFLLSMYFCYLFIKGSRTVSEMSEFSQLKNNLEFVVQRKLFPGVLCYLLFIDTLGYAVDVYAHTSEPSKFTNSTDTSPITGRIIRRDIEWFMDIGLILLDVLISIFIFTISGYGIPYDSWTELEHYFTNDLKDWELLKNVLQSQPKCYVVKCKDRFKHAIKILRTAIEGKCVIEEIYKESIKPKEDTIIIISGEDSRWKLFSKKNTEPCIVDVDEESELTHIKLVILIVDKEKGSGSDTRKVLGITEPFVTDDKVMILHYEY